MNPLLFVESVPLSEQQKKLGVPHFTHDFVVMTEFCEQRGPTPLMVWPNDRSHAHFDLNRFVVRVLSSDHTRKMDPSGMNSGAWGSPDDTQIYLTDELQRAHAYVHHLTLHDIHARGFVRPICFCYITRDPHKIMNNFVELMAMFGKISNTLKFGNTCTFISDVQEQLQLVLEGIEESSIFQTIIQEFPDFKVDIIKEVIFELSEMKQRFTQFIPSTTNKLEKQFLDMYYSSHHSSMEQLFHFSQLFEKGLGLFPSSLIKYMPIVLKFVHKRGDFDAQLRNIPLVCPSTFDLAHDFLLDALEHFSRNNFILQMEKEDLALISNTDPHSQLFIGKSFVTCFATTDLYAHSSLVHHYSSSSSLSPSHSNHFHPTPHYSTNTDSQQSPRFHKVAQLRQQDAIVPHTSDDNYSSCNDEAFEDAQDGGMESDSYEIHAHHHHHHHHHGNQSNHAAATLKPLHGFQHYSFNSTNSVLYRSGSNGCYLSNVWDYSSMYTIFNQQFSHTNRFSNMPIIPPGAGILKSMDFLTFIKEMVYSLMTGRLLVIHGLPEHEQIVRNIVTTFSLFVPGKNWTHKSPAIQKSTTLLPSVSEENEEESAIVSWRTRALTVQDLKHLKLVGLSKRATIPHCIENYVSKFDIERHALFAPPYRGDFLDKMFRRKFWPNEEAFISYIHEQFLQIANKACLYYHLHSIASVSQRRSNYTLQQQQQQQQQAPSWMGYISPIKKAPYTVQQSSQYYQQQVAQQQQPFPPVSPKQQRHRSISNPHMSKWDHPQQKSPHPTNPSVSTPEVSPPLSSMSNPSTTNTNTTSTTNTTTMSSNNTVHHNTLTSADSLANLKAMEMIKDNPKNILKRLGIRHSDTDIVEYLAEVIKEQQSRVVVPNLPKTIQLHYFASKANSSIPPSTPTTTNKK